MLESSLWAAKGAGLLPRTDQQELTIQRTTGRTQMQTYPNLRNQGKYVSITPKTSREGPMKKKSTLEKAIV